MIRDENVTAIILAAGQGTRLRPFTDNVPKCMVQINGRSMIEWQIDVLRSAGIQKIVAVTGYKEEEITADGLIKVHNPEYASTNMVYSLFCAEDFLKGEVFICYGDIVYSREVAEMMIRNQNDIVIASDENWFAYWSERFDDPLSDAETFLKGEGGKVISLGNKPNSAAQIEGQYIGLTRLNGNGCEKIKQVYQCERKDSLRTENVWNSGRSLRNAYMTDMLNHIAKSGDLYYQPIKGGWLEVDDPNDLKIAEKRINTILKNSY